MNVILDTNIFVAAGFNQRSNSATILNAIKDGKLNLIWNEPTRRETRKILEQIPRLSWQRFADMFDNKGEYTGEVHPQAYTRVEDYDDRKFAALANATDTVLISNDSDLLSVRKDLDISVLTPREFLDTWRD